MVSILVILTWTSNSSDMTPKQENLHHPKDSHGSSVKIWFFLLLEFLGFGTQIKGEQNTVLIVAHFFYLNFPNSISLNVSSSQTVCLKMQRNTSSSRNNVLFGSSFHEKLRIIMQSDFFFFFFWVSMIFPNFILNFFFDIFTFILLKWDSVGKLMRFAF